MLSKLYRGVIMATQKRQTGIRFDPELLYKISFVAKQNKRSLNAQLEFLAQECVKIYEQEHGDNDRLYIYGQPQTSRTP